LPSLVKHYMIKSLSFVFCIVMSVATFGQTTFDINWGELALNNGRLVQTLPSDSGQFYALSWSGGRIAGSYQVSEYKGLVQGSKGKIKLVVNKSYANFEGVRVIKGKFAVFLSDKWDGQNNFFVQYYNTELKPEGDPILLASYELDFSKGEGNFDVIASEDEKYFGVVWELEGKRDEKGVYGFKIFDQELNVINDGEYPLPFKAELTTIHSHYVSNQGDYFLVMTEFTEVPSKSLFKSYLNYKALHIIHITDTGLQDFTLDLAGRRIEALTITSDEKQVFTITGVYGDEGIQGVSGVFNQRIDYRSGIVLQEGFMKFDDAFITENWSDRAKKRAERLEDKGRAEDPKLYNYKMRSARTLYDGSVIGTMEQNYIQLMANSDIRTGQANDTYYYYYNDIIVYKVNVKGEFDWVKRIAKYQVSTNDDGPYSSYESFIDSTKISFIFNDNIDNYDDAGQFLDNQEIYSANFARRKNVVAIASIDYLTGAKSRSTLFDKSEIDALAIPKLFTVNYITGELLMYAIWGRDERFGVLKFK
jgi:hypothetical protein